MPELRSDALCGSFERGAAHHARLPIIVQPGNLQPRQSGSLSGNVAYPDGAAVAGARVKLQRAALGSEPQATSDAEGHFEFSSIDPGAYQLPAEAHGFMALNLDVAIVSGRASAACLE